MDIIFTLLFVLFLLLILVTLLVLPTFIAYQIYEKWMKKNYRRTGLALVAIVAIGTLYFIYSAFYPPAKFYRDEFRDSTNLELPKETHFIKKNAPYPDIHGSYCSAALVELPQEIYSSLLGSLQADKSFMLITPENRYAKLMGNGPLRKVEPENISYSYEFLKSPYEYIDGPAPEMYSYVAFLSDGTSLLFNNCKD